MTKKVRKSKNKLQETKMRGLSGWKLYTLLGVGIVGVAVGGGAYYASSEFDRRFKDSMGTELKADRHIYIGGEFRSITFWDKLPHLFHQRTIESNFSSHIDNFLTWLDRKDNRAPIEALVDLEYEKCGRIVSTNNDYEFQFIEPQLRVKMHQYIEELKRGDFSHAREASAFAANAMRGLENVSQADIELLRAFFDYAVPKFDRELRAGRMKMTDPLVLDYFTALRGIIKTLEGFNKGCPRDLKLSDTQRMIGTYHTHWYDPKLNPNPPTKGDIDNTYMLGPTFVFSFPTKETLSVYTILRGQSRLVGEYIIK